MNIIILLWVMLAVLFVSGLAVLAVVLLLRRKTPAAPRCPSCGMPLEAGWNVCPRCGAPRNDTPGENS